MARRGTHLAAAALAAPLLAAALVLADGPFFASRGRLSARRGFGRRGTIRSIAAGAVRIDTLSFVAVDSKGRIVVAGASDSGDIRGKKPVLARVLPGGELDREFGTDGIVVLPRRGDIESFALDRQDRPVVAGTFLLPPGFEGPFVVEVVRLTPGGQLDAEFSADGFVQVDDFVFAAPRRVATSPVDSSVYMSVSFAEQGVLRLEHDGTRTPGYFARPATNPQAMTVDASERLLTGSFLGIERFGPTGERDQEFGKDGVAVGPGGGPVGVDALSIDLDGRIVAIGSEVGTQGIFRFLPSGAPDGLFCEGGFSPLVLGVPTFSTTSLLAFGAPGRTEGPYAIASPLMYFRRNSGRFEGFGDFVQAIDPFDPAAVNSFVQRGSRRSPSTTDFSIPAVAVAPDGRTAYAAGGLVTRDRRGRIVRASPFLAAADLTQPTPLPLPDFRIEWDGPLEVRFDSGFATAKGRVRVTNEGRGRAGAAPVSVFLSADSTFDPADTIVVFDRTGPLPPRGTRTKDLRVDLFVDPSVVHGARLIAVVNQDQAIPEANPADDVAVSEPLP